MDPLPKVLLALLLGALILAQTGCAETPPAPDDLSATESPSSDDMSHGWTTGIAH